MNVLAMAVTRKAGEDTALTHPTRSHWLRSCTPCALPSTQNRAATAWAHMLRCACR